MQPALRDLDESGRAAGGPRLVLAPLNLPFELPADLDDAVGPVEEALRSYLHGRGMRVAVIWPPSDARALWNASVAGIRKTGKPARDLQAAAAAYAAALAGHTHFDVLLLPSLVYRKADVAGRYASWDGVRRRITLRSDASADELEIPPDSPVFGSEGVAAQTQWSGRIAALSLHVLVLQAGSSRQIQRWGGLDLVHDAVLPHDASRDPELRLRGALLGDAEHVREGIARALDGVRFPTAQ